MKFIKIPPEMLPLDIIKLIISIIAKKTTVDKRADFCLKHLLLFGMTIPDIRDESKKVRRDANFMLLIGFFSRDTAADAVSNVKNNEMNENSIPKTISDVKE